MFGQAPLLRGEPVARLPFYWFENILLAAENYILERL